MIDSALVIDALAFAADKHRRQRRRDVDASPYVNHPIALARILAVEGGISDPAVLCGALLHDTLEDTDATPEEIAARFGERIAAIVGEVTDDKSLPKAERKRLQIVHAASISREARLVKLADKISNVRDVIASPPHDWPAQRRQGYVTWASRVIDALRGTHADLEAAFDRTCGALLARRTVGVDGCRNAWLAVSRQGLDGALSLHVFDAAAALVAHYGDDALIAVDIPLGLSDHGPREADRLARRRLGGGRASSVFPTPLRAMLEAATRVDADATGRAIDGRGFGVQSFQILPKIRDWNAVLAANAAARASVHEIHPEVCFGVMAGGAIVDRKKSPVGEQRRRDLLAGYFGDGALDALYAVLPRNRAGIDDLHDALVALWSAERIATGRGVSLPDPPERDSAGMPRAIWY